MKTNLARLVLALTVAAACAVPTSAFADAGQGGLRLGADVTVFDVYFLPDTASDATVHAGVLSSGLTIPSSFAVHGAYQISDQFLVGARATFGVFSFNTFEFGVIGLLPFAEFLLMTGDIAPFVGAHVGPSIWFPDMGDAWANVIAGGEFGVHIFLDPAFSISPAIWGNFIYQGQGERGGFEFALLVSMSGWLFGGGAASPGPAAEPTPTTTTDPALGY